LPNSAPIVHVSGSTLIDPRDFTIAGAVGVAVVVAFISSVLSFGGAANAAAA
jgi:hypothetical protein